MVQKRANDEMPKDWKEIGIPRVFENDKGHYVMVSFDKDGVPRHVFPPSLPLKHGAAVAMPGMPLVSGVPLEPETKFGEKYGLTGAGAITAVMSEQSNVMSELQAIQDYVVRENARIEKNYDGETKEYLKKMLAYNVGHMVLDIDYKSLSVRFIDNLFKQFDTTFEEVKEAIRSDLDCREL